MAGLGIQILNIQIFKSLILFFWRRKWQPTPVFLPGDSQGQRNWWAAIYGVAESDPTEAT